MGLKEDIDKQNEEADRIYEEVYGAPDKAKDGDIPLDIETTPTLETPPPEDPPKVDPKPVAPKSDDYEQKYRTLQGIFDAEKRRLQGELDSVRSQMTDLAQKIATPPPPVKDPFEEDRTSFATEYPDVFKGTSVVATEKAREVIDKELTPLREEIKSLREQLGQTDQRVEVSVHDTYERNLDREVPEWRNIVGDPALSARFSEWLSEPIPYVGIPRAVVAQEADRKKDANTVIQFYHDFLRDSGMEKNEAPPPDNKNKMESFISPPSSPNASGAKKTETFITRAQVEQFNTDLSRGKYRDNPEKANAIQATIDKAARAGLIR